MKRGLLAAAMALTTAIGSAQTVTFTDVVDAVAPASSSVYSATYVPVADKYLVGHAAEIEIFSATGVKESNLNITGITPTGNGFFALVATDQGFVYAHEDGGKDIWRWSSVTDTPTKVYDTVNGLQRLGDASTIGNEIALAMTGNATDGPVEFFSDSFPFASGSFTFNESAQLDAKSGLAINATATAAYTIGDTGLKPLKKWVKTAGTWAEAPGWPTTNIVAGPIAYDDINDIVFVLDMRPNAGTVVNRNVKAFNGTTGALIGTDELTNLPGTIAGYAGSHVAPTANGGTLWFAARGATATDAVMYKWTYAVDTSSVDDWSLYQQ